jgi:hypothetical protein
MLVPTDPVDELRRQLLGRLAEEKEVSVLKSDEPIGPAVHWRPHVFDVSSGVAWHILSEKLESDFWARRMAAAKEVLPTLTVGVALPEHLVYNEELLRTLNDLSARIAIFRDQDESSRDRPNAALLFNTIADVIYANRLRLGPSTAAHILNRLLERCHGAKEYAAKGVALEVLTAVLLSQVDGFEVTSVGVSNRSQQIDVRVHNRNAAGALGRSEIVIAEAKNWAFPVGTTEYFAVYRKLETRFGRSRLGYFVTTDRFTRGVELERLRDSKGDILVVPLDKVSLPGIWRDIEGQDTITRRLEHATIEAASQ